MKKLMFLMTLLALVIAGCGGKGSRADEQKMDPATQSEIRTLDSLSFEIDSLKSAIDKAAGDVDEMIDKL
ncbi:MAG: hypothetical protein ACOYXB_16300 [Bacteroidota bacterium]